MKFTVLGSEGFIGRHLVSYLRARNFEVETPSRDAARLRGKKLGHVIYSIGLTGNFRTRPKAAIDAHVNVLQELMDGADFESWLYLSSTRVYSGMVGNGPVTEDMALSVRSGMDSVYDLSKLLGESICLGRSDATIRVARLSNVYGAGQSEHTFLGSVIRDLMVSGRVLIGESPLSSKDYISIRDAVAFLVSIATRGRHRLYNVAGGRSVTHRELADVVRACGYVVEFCTGAPMREFPSVGTARLVGEFGGKLQSILDDLPILISEAKQIRAGVHSETGKDEKVRQ